MESLRVLSAMLVLGKFTIQELAEQSGVKLATVQTVVARRRELVEEVERVSTGKKGGQPARYLLRSEQRGVVEAEIRQLFRSISTPSTPASSPEAVAELPLELDIADDILLRQYPRAARPDDRRELIRAAKASLLNARTFPEGSRFARYAEGLHLLSRLGDLEVDAATHNEPPVRTLLALMERNPALDRVVNDLQEVGETKLAFAVAKRYMALMRSALATGSVQEVLVNAAAPSSVHSPRTPKERDPRVTARRDNEMKEVLQQIETDRMGTDQAMIDQCSAHLRASRPRSVPAPELTQGEPEL